VPAISRPRGVPGSDPDEPEHRDAARVAHDPVRTYLAIAVVVLLLSLWPPLTLDADAGAKATLAAMHVVTAAICVVVFTRRSPTSR
jgi:Family of unknown function (DUF6069)